MKATIEKREGNSVLLKVTVEPEQVESGLERAYRKVVRNVSVPGFRKGKAPRRVLEMRYGEEIFYEDLIDILVPEAYEAALKEHELEPVERPDVEVEEIGKDRLTFTASVTVKPEVQLGDYKGIQVTKTEYPVSDKLVDREISRLQERAARLVTREDKTAEHGDFVLIDYTSKPKEDPDKETHQENQMVELDPEKQPEGLVENLVGAKAGDTREFVLSLKDGENEVEVAFTVTVKEIKEKELPELDDEFAKDVSDFETLDELKADIKKRLKENSERKSRNELERQLLSKVAENSEVDIPEVMIERQLDRDISRLDRLMRLQGSTLEAYLASREETMEDLRKQMKAGSTTKVKEALVLEAIARQEDIEATAEEIEARLKERAERFGNDIEETRNRYEEEVRGEIIDEKTIDFLVDNATIRVETHKEEGGNNDE